MCLSPVGLVCCMWSRISRCWWPNWSWRISERFGGMDLYIIYFTFTLTHKKSLRKKTFLLFYRRCSPDDSFLPSGEIWDYTREKYDLFVFTSFFLEWKMTTLRFRGVRWPINYDDDLPHPYCLLLLFFCNRLFHVHIVQIHLNGLQYHEVCPLLEKKLLLVLSAPTMGSACANWCNVNITHG